MYTVLLLPLGRFPQHYKVNLNLWNTHMTKNTKHMTKNTKNARLLAMATDRPTCINHGCGRPASYTRRNLNGTFRWRVTCSHCQGAAWGRQPHRDGVTPYKTGHCSNQDGGLGFRCFTDLARSPIAGLTEIDHINGNHCDNDPNNLQELCQACHAVKGRWNRDFARQPAKATGVIRC